MKIVDIISGIVKNLRTGAAITDFGVAVDETSKERCCGPDCCDGNGVYHWRDQVPATNGAKYVTYVKNGTLTTVTEAAYLADRANNFA